MGDQCIQNQSHGACKASIVEVFWRKKILNKLLYTAPPPPKQTNRNTHKNPQTKQKQQKTNQTKKYSTIPYVSFWVMPSVSQI